MVVIPFCCPYRPRSTGIFNLTHLCICNGLAAAWGPYWTTSSCCIRPLEIKVKAYSSCTPNSSGNCSEQLVVVSSHKWSVYFCIRFSFVTLQQQFNIVCRKDCGGRWCDVISCFSCIVCAFDVPIMWLEVTSQCGSLGLPLPLPPLRRVSVNTKWTQILYCAGRRTALSYCRALPQRRSITVDVLWRYKCPLEMLTDVSKQHLQSLSVPWRLGYCCRPKRRYAASHPTTLAYSSASLWESQIPHWYFVFTHFLGYFERCSAMFHRKMNIARNGDGKSTGCPGTGHEGPEGE